MKLLLLPALLMTLAQPSFATSERTLSFTQTPIHSDEKVLSADKDYFTVSKITVREIEDDYVAEKDTVSMNKGLGEIIMMGDKLIAFGQKVWEIVKAGKPTNTTNFVSPISVLPGVDKTGQAFYEMENWAVPRVKKFEVKYENLLGMTVISFTYGVHYQSGGSYQGKGKYLTGVNIEASDVYVAWGFSLDASSSLVAISNMGSSANANAAATMKINYTAKSVLQTFSASESFHVTGSGEFFPIQ